MVVRRMVEDELAPYVGLRFGKHDRVVCHLAGRRAWAAGTIIELDRDDQENGTQIPYLVKIDPPNGRVICVPRDDNHVVRAEFCFWDHAHTLPFTLFCKPRKQTEMLRFGVGGRVACAVEDYMGNEVTWAAGTVLDVNYDAGSSSDSWDWPCVDGIVPYRVLLDAGGHVLVHRDEHWLVRDLRLQPASPSRHSAAGPTRRSRFTLRDASQQRLWTPQQTQLFPRQFQERALATLCVAHRLRTNPPTGVVCLGDVPAEILLDIIAASAGREQLDHQTRQIRVQSGFDSDDE